MKFWTADSFTNQAFKGNPAAICIVEKFPTDELMQKIAAEINLSKPLLSCQNLMAIMIFDGLHLL